LVAGPHAGMADLPAGDQRREPEHVHGITWLAPLAQPLD
jgi:hypothetical protein